MNNILQNANEVANAIKSEKHSNHHRDRFFPEMINRLGLLSGAEIGVDKAGFSEHILNKTSIEKYYCVDTWQDDFGSEHRPGYFNNDGNVRFNQAKEVLDKFGDRAIMMRMTGMEAALQIPNSRLDFVYIDGDHSLEGIYMDIKAWLPKLRVGGILAGHDYKDGPGSGIAGFNGKQLPYRIKTVVDDYCQRYGYEVHAEGGRILSWWIVKDKPTEDHVKAYLLGNPNADI